jgi:hypothetical protein
MRSVLRMELPSTKAAMTWIRLAVLSWFMLVIILERSSISQEEAWKSNISEEEIQQHGFARGGLVENLLSLHMFLE